MLKFNFIIICVMFSLFCTKGCFFKIYIYYHTTVVCSINFILQIRWNLKSAKAALEIYFNNLKRQSISTYNANEHWKMVWRNLKISCLFLAIFFTKSASFVMQWNIKRVSLSVLISSFFCYWNTMKIFNELGQIKNLVNISPAFAGMITI